MKTHRYILEPYKGMCTRHRCPSCNKNKTFTLYLDTQTNQHIHPTVGRCNRAINCAYHYPPAQYFKEHKMILPQSTFNTKQKPVQIETTEYIPVDIFKASLKTHTENHFVQYLLQLFGTDITNRLIAQYFIGSSKHWPGATVFWQIDNTGNIRTGKIMLYKPDTGRRVKQPFNHVTWAHTLLNKPVFHLKQCLFGEHLSKDKTKHVAVVESEKTAIIASVYLPQFIWLAAGSLGNLTAEKCKALKNRTVHLFPDLNAFNHWQTKANELKHITRFNVSTLLETKAPTHHRQHGYDLADDLVNCDYREFVLENKALVYDVAICDVATNTKPNNWIAEIEELETFFNSVELPTGTVKLNPYTTIHDLRRCIDVDLAQAKRRNGNVRFGACMSRLREVKSFLESG